MKPVTVYVNVSEPEIGDRQSGEFTYYREVLRINHLGVQFVAAPHTSARRFNVFTNKVGFRIARATFPTAFRRTTLVTAKYTGPLPAHVPDGSSVLLSHLQLPIGGGRLPAIWSSQGLAASRQWTLDDNIWLLKRAARRCRAFVTWSNQGAETIRNAAPSLAHLVRAIHPPLSWPEPAATKTLGGTGFLFVGLDGPRKGLPLIVDAFERSGVARHGATLHCITATKWPDPPTGVTISPPSSHRAIRSLMRTSDVLVLASEWESYGYVVVEAQAAGCAVIVSDVAALPELASDAGLVAPVGNRDAWIEAFRQFATETPQLRMMQTKARTLYESRNTPSVFAEAIRKVALEITAD